MDTFTFIAKKVERVHVHLFPEECELRSLINVISLIFIIYYRLHPLVDTGPKLYYGIIE